MALACWASVLEEGGSEVWCFPRCHDRIQRVGCDDFLRRCHCWRAHSAVVTGSAAGGVDGSQVLSSPILSSIISYLRSNHIFSFSLYPLHIGTEFFHFGYSNPNFSQLFFVGGARRILAVSANFVSMSVMFHLRSFPAILR